MKKILVYILPAICAFLLFSCEKEKKLYEGPAQIAFDSTTKTYVITSEITTISVPIQLIASGPQGAINASVAVNGTGTTCASSVTVPSSVTIDAGKYSAQLVINVTHSTLVTGTTNKLVLDLTSTGIKVAENYKTITITLNKINR